MNSSLYKHIGKGLRMRSRCVLISLADSAELDMLKSELPSRARVRDVYQKKVGTGVELLALVHDPALPPTKGGEHFFCYAYKKEGGVGWDALVKVVHADYDAERKKVVHEQ